MGIFFRTQITQIEEIISLTLGMGIWETAIFFRTQITQIVGIISLTLGIDICEIPNICGCFIPNTDITD